VAKAIKNSQNVLAKQRKQIEADFAPAKKVRWVACWFICLHSVERLLLSLAAYMPLVYISHTPNPLTEYIMQDTGVAAVDALIKSLDEFTKIVDDKDKQAVSAGHAA
jgi:hypothetical protein